MKKLLAILLIILPLLSLTSGKNKVYLFSYFKGNGEDGLHLAYSRDGRNFASLNDDKSFLTPPQKNIRVTTSNSLYDPYSAPSDPITGKYWAEGPTAIKIDDSWFVYFDKYTEKKMGAVASKDLINWQDISDKITFPDGVRHGTIIEVDEKILNRILNR